MTDKKNDYSNDMVNFLRGLMMGAADIIPGVSGGTVALILGHYERLVRAIARVDRQFVSLLLARQFGAAFKHIDARFLIGLLAGILTGIVGLASVMHYLLEHQQAYLFAALCGAILASSYLVAKRMKGWDPTRVVWLAIGVVAAVLICRLSPMHGQLNYLTAFLSAIVAICAMILPGISGAFILLMLGMYFPVTELVKELPRGGVGLTGVLTLACFGAGCLVGLLSFTRFLRWCLAHHHDSTMSMLIGLMIGSLYRIWPFQVVTPETIGLPLKQQVSQMVWPSQHPASLVVVLGLVVAGLVATVVLESIGSRLSSAERS